MRIQQRDTVKAICFDVDGTLYGQAGLRFRMGKRLLCAWMNGTIRARDIKILRMYRSHRERARRLGIMPDLEGHVLQSTADGLGCNVRQVADVVEAWITNRPLSELATMADTRVRQGFQRLRLRGYRLGVFSDYPVTQKLEALGLPASLFDAIVEAGEPQVSALKPHPGGFLEVCRRLQMVPEQVLYVGDRRTTDGEGARRAGLPFVRYRPYALSSRWPKSLRNLLHLEWCLSACGESAHALSREGCWLCGESSANEFSPSRISDDLTPDFVKITDSRYGQTARLLECTACGFVYAEQTSAKALESLYEGLVDHGYQESSRARRKAFARILHRIRRLCPQAVNLLDIGASTGVFCDEARKSGFAVEGVEPSEWAVAEARRQYGVMLHRGYFPHPAIEGKQFDVVTMLDIIEHVSQPVELLRAARRCLVPNGLLIIVTPDINSFVARLMGTRWWHFRPAHIGYFSRETMQAALGAAGFNLEHVEPYVWWFPLDYLMKRIAVYFPIGSAGRAQEIAGQSPRGLRWIWRMSVPVNLRDSYVYFAKPIGSDSCSIR